MFKLTYQAFVIFYLSTPFVIIQTLKKMPKKFRFFYYPILAFFLFFIFIYPLFAIRSYYGLKNYQSLDGLAYLKTQYSNDYQAILWLRQHVSGQPVIVEAVGESYTDFARVSANTGLPTILGWRVHEWLWRGSFDEAGKRTEEVKTIYESPNSTTAQQLLNQYKVKYIFVGALERKQYPQLQVQKFELFGKPVFSSGETKIYEVRN